VNRVLLFIAIAMLVVAISSCGGGSSSTGGGTTPPPPPPPSPDFSISASPASATVPPGGVLLLQVSVTAEHGFNDSVNVSVTGLPSGATVSPASPLTMSPGSQTLTLLVASNTAQGNFTVTLQGSSGSLQHSTTFALDVQTQTLANFSLAPNGTEVSLTQGGSANIGVGLVVNSNTGNPNYEVEFSVTGLPAGVQATFAANPFIATQPATLMTISASTTSGLANYGTVTLIATRTADGVQESAPLTLNVVPPVGTLPAIRTDFVRMDGTPAAAVYDSAHSVVYASNPQWNRVDVISTTTHQMVNSIPAPNPTGMDMSLDGKHLIVTSNVEQIVSIDTTSLQVVGRTSVTPVIQEGAPYAVPDLLANTSNGNALVGMTNFSSPPSYFLTLWNPATGSFEALTAPGIGAFINQLVRTGDGAKALVVDYGSDLNMAVYDAASNIFTASGQSPVGQVLGVAGSPTAEQFAIQGTSGLAIVDSNLNTLGTPPSGGIYWGMTYSADGTKLYVTMTLSDASCGMNYPVILTYDTSSFLLTGTAPGFESGSGNECTPYVQASPLAADNTGLLYSAYSHGMVLDDTANLQNVLNLPVGPLFPTFGFADEAAFNTALATSLGNQSYDLLPDVWFANTRGTNIQFSTGLVSVTAPPSANAGLINVKTVSPDGWLSLAPQAFSYGTQILFLGGNAGSTQGGASLAIIGYGLIGNSGAAPTVTIGGQSAQVTDYSKYVDITDSGYNLSYPFPNIDEVLATVPSGSIGSADVSITSEAGTATLAKAFNYISVSDYASADTLNFVLYDSQRHWVYLSAGDHIDVFSADTSQFLAPIVPPTVYGMKLLKGLALTPDHSKLLVTNWSDLSLAIIDPDNPSSSSVVQVVASGLSGNPGPYTVAATSAGTALVTTGGSGGAPVYVVDLSTLGVTTPFNSLFGSGGRELWSTSSGNYVMMDGALWSATTNGWAFSLPLRFDNNDAASGDGYWFASDYTRLDSQMIQHTQAQVPEFFSILLSFPDLAGEKMNGSGSLLYTPVPIGTGNVESNGVSITDTNLGTWIGQVLLTEQILGSPIQSAMDFDEAGNRVFLITDKGLTVVQLASPPLSIGYLNPATGAAAGGTSVTIRGSGFESGATVNFGSTRVSATFVDGGTLQVTTPVGSTGGARVSIANPDGTSYSLDAGFTYQ
jgi:IPT/TIG domain